MKSAIAVLFIVVTAAIHAEPPRVPNQATLVCRMGGSMVWSTISELRAVPTALNGKNVRVPVISAMFAQLVFSKSKTPVAPDGAGLASGVCGWSDRAMTAQEPNRVVENIDSATFQRTVLWGNGSTTGGSMSMSGGHLNPQNNTVFTMQVVRDATADVQFKVIEGTVPKVIGK